MPPAVIASAIAVFAVAMVAAAVAPLADRDEPTYAEVVREMRATGDWLVPRNFGVLFADKPPGMYWLQGASTALLGESELALRLPSAVAAGCLLILGAAIATRLGADGRIAGTLALPGIVVAGMFATPDAPVAAASALSLWAFLRAADGADRWVSALLGWTALAAGVALKGPAAPLFAGAAVLGRLWGDRPAWRRLHWLPGLALLAGLTALWFVPSNLATGWAYARSGVGQDVVARALQPLEHHGVSGLLGVLVGPPFYLLTLLAVALPVGAAPWALWRQRETLPPVLVRTVLSGIAIPFTVLCVVATKLPHYLLPLLPLVAVAAAGARRTGRLVAWIASVLILAAVVVATSLAPWRAMGRAVASGPPVLTVGTGEPSLLFYARGNVSTTTPTALVARARIGTVLALLREREGWSARLARVGVDATRLGAWHGLNLAKGRWERVELLRLTPAAPVQAKPGE